MGGLDLLCAVPFRTCITFPALGWEWGTFSPQGKRLNMLCDIELLSYRDGLLLISTSRLEPPFPTAGLPSCMHPA
jgi:hypothetical protein